MDFDREKLIYRRWSKQRVTLGAQRAAAGRTSLLGLAGGFAWQRGWFPSGRGTPGPSLPWLHRSGGLSPLPCPAIRGAPRGGSLRGGFWITAGSKDVAEGSARASHLLRSAENLPSFSLRSLGKGVNCAPLSSKAVCTLTLDFSPPPPPVSFILKIKPSVVTSGANYFQSSSCRLNVCFFRYLFPAVGCLR